MSPSARAAGSPDVIGLGALNVDLIASASRLSRRAEERITESDSRFEVNTEGAVSEEVILRTMNQLGSHSLDASLGGSAWNTIFSLAQMNSGISLGYVGVLGRVEAPGISFTRQMAQFGIDTTMLRLHPQQRSGICLSFIEDDERVLLTSPCANRAMAEYLDSSHEEVVGYLSGAKLVHVTSFLDPITPAKVAQVLEDALALNPHLLIAFDPGHEWAFHPSEAIERILAVSHLVFLNYQEFKALGEYTHGEMDDVVGRRALARCAPESSVFVMKRYDLTEVFSRQGTRTEAMRFTHQFNDPQAGIEDATGAGDVFAAAVIAAMLSQRLRLDLGAHLGLALARHKLRYIAATGHSRFPDLTRGFLQTREQLPEYPRSGGSILIAHDGRESWRALTDFLGQHCALPVTELTPTDPQANPSSLSRQQLGEAGFAVCVLAPEQNNRAAGTRADERLVHYAGFLQGRLGFDKVALLVEQGCQTFSNMAGLVRLPFRAGHVEDAFIELQRMLRREGLVP